MPRSNAPALLLTSFAVAAPASAVEIQAMHRDVIVSTTSGPDSGPGMEYSSTRETSSFGYWTASLSAQLNPHADATQTSEWDGVDTFNFHGNVFASGGGGSGDGYAAVNADITFALSAPTTLDVQFLNVEGRAEHSAMLFDESGDLVFLRHNSVVASLQPGVYTLSIHADASYGDYVSFSVVTNFIPAPAASAVLFGALLLCPRRRPARA